MNNFSVDARKCNFFVNASSKLFIYRLKIPHVFNLAVNSSGDLLKLGKEIDS
jgi:hypothetical protein